MKATGQTRSFRLSNLAGAGRQPRGRRHSWAEAATAAAVAGADGSGSASPASSKRTLLNLDTHLVRPSAHLEEHPSNLSKAITYIKTGLFSLITECMRGFTVYKPLGLIILMWECVQLWSFTLSLSPLFPWDTTPFLSEAAAVLQVIAFGYFVPDSLGIDSVLYAIAFSIAAGAVILTVWLTVALHPTQEHPSTRLEFPVRVLRWLLLLMGTGMYLPIVQQLISVFQCDVAAVLQSSMNCWDSNHELFVSFSVVLLPCVIVLAATTVLCMFERDLASKDPFARAHGRVLLLFQVIKLIGACTFAADEMMGKWALVLAVAGGHVLALYLFVWYLPFYWQLMNQVAAGCLSAGFASSAVLFLAAVRDDARTDMPAVAFAYCIPGAIGFGVVVTSLQWHQWVADPDTVLSNSMNVELKVRRLLSDDDPSSRFETVETIYSESLQFFPRDSILHMFIAQYLHDFRHNRHLASSHVQVLESKNGLPDEQFFVFLWRSRIQDETQGEQSKHLSARLKFGKHAKEAQALTVQARQLQLSLWSELASPVPSWTMITRTTAELAEAMRNCEEHFAELMSLHTSSVSVMRMYAQYLEEVANDVARAQQLMESADELEVIQQRASDAIVEFHMMAPTTPLDSTHENVPSITISTQPHNLGDIIDTNAASQQLLGYTRRDLLTKNIRVLIPEPIASVHQQFLEAYLATGHGIMVNHTRMLLVVHASGYVLPAAQTIRNHEEGLTSFLRPLHTMDFFCLVSLPDKKLTAGCEFTLTAARISVQHLRNGVVGISRVFPNFDDMWAEFLNDAEMYREASIAKLDGMPGGGTLIPPSERVYLANMNLAHGHVNSTETSPQQVYVKFQHVQLPGCVAALIKWRRMESENTTRSASTSRLPSISQVTMARDHMPATIHEEDDSSDSENSVAEVNDDNVDQHAAVETKEIPFPGTRSGKFPSSSFPAAFVALERKLSAKNALMASANGLDRPDGVLPKRRSGSPRSFKRSTSSGGMSPAHGNPNVSGGGEQHSVASGSSFGSGISLLRKKLSRSSSNSNPTLLKLKYAILAVITIASAVCIAEYVSARLIVPGFQDNLLNLSRNKHRQMALQDALLRAQDMLLMSESYIPATKYADRSQELVAFLEEFETVHNALYMAADTPQLVAAFADNTMPIRLLDNTGQVIVIMNNLLSVGLDFINNGRLTAATPIDKLSRNNPHLWYLMQNGPVTLVNRLASLAVARTNRAVATFETTQSYRRMALVSVLVLFAACSCFLIMPATLLVRRAELKILSALLEVPSDVFRCIQQQSQVRLAAAQWLDKLEKEDHNPFAAAKPQPKDDKAHAQLMDALDAARMGTNKYRPRRTLNQRWLGYVLLIGILWAPLLLVSGFYVGLYFWGVSFANNLSTSTVSFYYGMRSELRPAQVHFYLRRAALQYNSTLALQDLQTSLTFVQTALSDEQTFMFGSKSLGASPALDLPPISYLMLDEGCLSVSDTACQHFNHELFKSGLHAALTEYLRLSTQQARADKLTLAAHATYNKTAVQATFATDSFALRDEMAHTYLRDGFDAAPDFIYAYTGDLCDQYLTGLIVVTVLAVISLGVLYACFYQRQLDSLDQHLRNCEGLLILVPAEVTRAIPPLRDMVKQLMTEMSSA